MTDVLLMEDEVTIREVLAEYMRMSGYRVFEAADGRRALKILEEQTIDLAVLDIMVPPPDGVAVLQAIRSGRHTADIGVIMLTALDDIKTQVSAFNAFADDYIVKPASPIILLKRMETLLRRIRPRQPQTGGLQVDKDAYRAYFDGEDLGLTVSEFLLLKLLWDNRGRVLSREQLINGVFHEEYTGNDRIIDAHVKNLRKKLPRAVIKTVIGVGYRFDEGPENMSRGLLP
ncbi:MAG: response regulator transcription factor [Lachnospiraceae bacterium]|nr:response regulator transcription factor [Lachnospiraceae bacterium]MDY5742457.1 response regulator transcription factor [Lachnospiraceae bacterium]